jgi:hypothetical protein
MAGGNGDVVDQTGVTGTNDGKKGKTGGKNGKKGKNGKNGKNGGGKDGLTGALTLADPITPAVTEAVAVHVDPAAKLPLARIIV